MPEEKQADVIYYENVPENKLGLFIYIGDRLKRNATQLASGVRGIFNPVFTHDTDDEALLEDNDLSEESEDCKPPSTLAEPPNNIFDAEYEKELKKAKMNVEQNKELLKRLESVNTPIPEKTHDANIPHQLDDLSERINTLLASLNDKIWSLSKERGVSAAQKAGALSAIRIQILNLQSNIEHEYPRKNALLQAITAARASIIENQTEISNYRSKWGSGFFFGTLLRRDLAKRVTSKVLIDDLDYELDDMKRSINLLKIR